MDSSLAVAHEALELFNRISYFKVKSNVLSLGLDASTRNKLRLQYPYTWSTGGIKYLGITLTTNVEQLYRRKLHILSS